MPSIYEVYPNELIEKTAEKLKQIEEIKAPEWSIFVKTGPHKERPPMDNDWWFFRAAAILRSVYRLGPVGVNKLRTKYGGKKRRGHQPPTFKKGSGNIIRKCLQQLEKAGLVKNIEKGQHKGRILTPKGVSLLDKTAGEILKTKPKSEKIEIPKKAKKSPKVGEKKEKPAEVKGKKQEAKEPAPEAKKGAKQEPKEAAPKVEEKKKEAPAKEVEKPKEIKEEKKD